MSNIIDYIEWRGDITLKMSPFNEADALILTQISMIDLGGIVPPVEKNGEISVSEAARAFFADEERSSAPLGLIIPPEIVPMLQKLADSRRYADMKLCAYVNNTDPDTQQQFSAITVKLGDGSSFISFRGTDDTLIGWKEDLNMVYLPSIPSQVEAVTYFDRVGKRIRGDIRVGGHSKGGNLAVFSAVKCRDSLRRRIREVYNFDGPGFHREFLSLKEYRELDGRIKTVVPQSSLVGLLFEHDGKYTVIKSTESGLLQHNALSWETTRDGLCRMPELTKHSREVSKQINEMLYELDRDARKRFVEAVYGVIASTDATTLTELYDDRFTVIRSLSKTDKDTRRMVLKILGLMIGEGGGQVFSALVHALFKSKKSHHAKADASKNDKAK